MREVSVGLSKIIKWGQSQKPYFPGSSFYGGSYCRISFHDKESIVSKVFCCVVAMVCHQTKYCMKKEGSSFLIN